MLRKKSFYVVLLLIGIGLLGLALYFRTFPQISKSIGGICIGIGAGLFGMSLSNLYMKRLEEKEPKIRKQNEIEFKDERNTVIRNRAKAKAGDIIQWFIMGVAYILIFINAPLWVTLVTVLVFLLYNVLELYYMYKYQKEM